MCGRWHRRYERLFLLRVTSYYANHHFAYCFLWVDSFAAAHHHKYSSGEKALTDIEMNIAGDPNKITLCSEINGSVVFCQSSTANSCRRLIISPDNDRFRAGHLISPLNSSLTGANTRQSISPWRSLPTVLMGTPLRLSTPKRRKK